MATTAQRVLFMAAQAEDFKLEDFCFTALPSDYKLLKKDEIEAQILEIIPQDLECRKQFDSVWGRMYSALSKYHEHTGSNCSPGWTKWDPGKWSGSTNPTDRQKFAAWIGPTVVGFLNLRANYPSVFSSGEQVLYVEHIAAAPGYISTAIWGRRLASVGTSLMAFSVLQSIHQGFGGRLGLHAADGEAEAYYTNINRARQLFDVVARREITGTPEDRKASSRPYFETNPERAIDFLEGYRHA